MKVLVTGAAGFIGSHLAEALLAAGDTVVGIDGFIDNYAVSRKREHLEPIADHPRFRLVDAMIQDLDLEDLLDGVARVFHLAALPGVRSSWGASFADYTTYNVLASQHLLEASLGAGVERFVYASSSSVYGDTEVLPSGEDARERPFSPYGVTKLAAEHLARLYHRNHGLHTVSLRYFTVYGPRQRPDMAIQRFLTSARTGEPIVVFGDGEQTRDFTFVHDIVEATRRGAERGAPGGIYNVGGGSTVTVNALVEMVERVTGRSLDIDRRGQQLGDVRHTRADVSRARCELDFVPATPLEEGLRQHWAWLNDVSEI